jgi:tetratricopeptide (TPR) repeat protein
MDGKRMLVVLDNAASSDQVRPLIPGSPACRVLVTSRDRLSGLIAREGARRISLDPLAPGEALALLGRILGGERADAAPQATAELARVCAYLPLAIRAAATNLANHPHKTIDSYVSELARIGADRLAALEVDGDEDAAVRAAFDVSYRALQPDTRRGFCFLGLAPGQDITVPASAALTGTTVEAAGRLLDRLAAGHLIGQHSTGRYRMHDLLRHYAAHQADAEHSRAERERAVTRLTGWYLAATDSAAGTLYPHLLRLPAPQPPPGAQPVTFANHAEALAWLDAERANLIAVVQHAAARGPRRVAWLLGDALRGYFTLRRHMVDWLTVARAALAAAGHDQDLRAQSTARLSLAHAYWSLGRYEESGEHYAAALDLATEAGWRECRATCLGNLGLVHWEMGRLAEAAGYLTEALEEDRQTERWAGVANNLANLGYVYREMGRLTEAADHGAGRPTRSPTSARCTTTSACWTAPWNCSPRRWPATRRSATGPTRRTPGPRARRCTATRAATVRRSTRARPPSTWPGRSGTGAPRPTR